MKILLILLLPFLLISCEDNKDNVAADPYTITMVSGSGTSDAFGRISESHTCVLTSESKIKCWGGNSFGQLGLGDRNSRGDDSAAADMGNNLSFVDLGTNHTAKAVATGGLHTCAILENDSVKCWGYNFYGQLGIESFNTTGDEANEMGDNLPIVNLGTGRTAKSLALGRWHSCAILDNNSMKCWGYNQNGELGQGDSTSRGTFVGTMGDALIAINLGTGRTALSLASGDHHVCAILDNSSVKCWGRNASGQLGQESTNNLGDVVGEMGDALPAVNFGTGRTATKIVAGGDAFYGHTCVLRDNSTVVCWGRNASGQLGIGDINDRGDNAGEMGDTLTAVGLGTGLTVTDLIAGKYHNCAILSNHQTKCWGNNTFGELGQGHTNNLGDNGSEMDDNLPAIELGTGRTATKISASSHTCAILDNDRLKCWGNNFTGELGLGDRVDRGDLTNQMGENLPFVNVGDEGSPVLD